MWQQDYAPLLSSVGWSAAVASLPVLVLLFLLAIRRKPAWMAAVASLLTAIAVARLGYRMPLPRLVSASLFGAAFGLLPIGWITWNAILLFRLTVATGQLEGIKRSLALLTTDRRLSALVIAFAFGAFIEGAAGSGVPVAVGAAMLTAMGFGRLEAAGICLLANTAPVAFGAIGLPVLTLALTTGLPVAALSAGVGRLSAPLALCVPSYMIVLVSGWKGLRGVLPAALICGLSFALVQRLASSLLGPELTDILASLAAMTCLLALFRVWRPRDGTADLPRDRQPAPRPGRLLGPWIPYLLLAACVLFWGLPPVKAALRATSPTIAWPALHDAILRMPPVVRAPTRYAAEYRLDWLASSGTACLLASLLSAALAGMSPRKLGALMVSTARQMLLPLLTIVSVLALAFVMNYSGATATLGLAFAGTGALFPFFSPLLGWIGVFLTGSDASSNALFGGLQVVTAQRLGLDPVLMASANSAGGVMGKMISVQSIAVAAAATGMPAAEQSQLFRLTVWHSVILVCAMGVLTMLYAHLLPGFAR